MAKISELADGGNLLNDDELIVLRAGGNVRATVANLPEIDSSGNMAFADNEKATFGTGNDLQVYHNGSNSYIQDVGTGSLIFRSSTATLFQGNTAGENQLTLAENGAVTAYYDNIARLATTSTGIDVTGTATMDGLTVNTTNGSSVFEGTGISSVGIQFKTNASNRYLIQTPSASADLAFLAGGTTKSLNLGSNGNVQFFEDTGTTAKFHWDASAEALGIGTDNPRQDLEIFNGDTGSGIRLAATATAYWDIERDPTSGHLTFTDDGAGTVLTVGQNGKVGIGTDDPALFSKLHVSSTTTALDAGGTIFASVTDAVAADIGGQVMMGGYYTGTSTAAFGGLAAKKENATAGNFGGYLQFLTSTNGSGNTEKMRITSDGSVGIGTDNPSTKLHVNAGTGNIAATFESTDAGSYINLIDSASGTYGAMIGASGDDIVFSPNNVEAMRIDSSQNLLVGTTTSRGTKATIEGTSALVAAQGVLDINSTNALGANLGATVSFGGVSTSGGAKSRYAVIGGRKENATDGNYAGYFQIATTNVSGTTSEAMRIDSDGNLKVGYSSTGTPGNGNTDTGHLLKNDGRLFASSASNSQFNRNSDGDIVTFRQSGDLVGSVGTQSGDVYISSSATGHGGLRFANGSILPLKDGVLNAGEIDLGQASGDLGFKDLYLSGAVNLGDTHSVNWGTGNERITGLSSSNSLRFVTGNVEACRIDSSQNLLVGGTSYEAAGSIGFKATGEYASLLASGTGGEIMAGGAIALVSNGYQISVAADNSQTYKWHNGGSRSMTLDSSGNLLVGKTSAAVGTDGAQLLAGGYSGVSATSTTAFFANRNTTDGDVVEIGKNGVKVGSIGTEGGALYISSPYGNDSGLRFVSGIVGPATTTGANRDGAIDLGYNNGRFKDLYLSGGAYLGGTAAANKLDSYEEGTWTPVYSPTAGSFTTMTMDVVSATYTKIGDSVFVRAYIRTDDVDATGASGSVIISGLPFASDSSSSVAVGYTDGWQQAPLAGYVSGNDIYLLERSSVSSDVSNSNVGDLTDGTNANSNVLVISGTYRTTA